MTRSDLPRVLEIYNQGIREGTSTFTTECPSADEWDASHLPYCRLVCTDGGHILGFLALTPTSARKAYSGSVEVSIYVDENSRGRGVGTRLMNSLFERAEQNGIWSVLSVILENNTASMEFHKKLGFRVIGYREKIARDRFGVWRNTVLAEYRLPCPDGTAG